jgi:hypothetical protein
MTRRFLLCVLCGFCVLCGDSFLFSISARAQELDKPLQTIDEEITGFAFAPDGRIAYAVHRGFKTKEYDLEHDDIWILESGGKGGGKRRRILQGDKFIRGTQPFTYSVDAFRWSPNGRMLLAQLFTTTIVDQSGKTEDSINTLVLEDNGKEVRPGGTDSLVTNAANATWLLDGATFVYMTEVVKPRTLFSFKMDNVATGPVGLAFEGRTFLASTPIPHTNVAIAVERDRNLSGPPRLQRLELLAQDDTELATLDGYQGGLSVSADGKYVAYFIDKEVLEIRDVASPTHVARLRVGFGQATFTPDDSRIFLKHGEEKKSGDLVAIRMPALATAPAGQELPITEPNMQPLLHGVTIREFSISPDGRLLGVVPPGKRSLLIFPMP